MLRKYTIGIDPGKTGAAALVADGRDVVEVIDFSEGVMWPRLSMWCQMCPPELAVLEEVNARPPSSKGPDGKRTVGRIGATSAFSFGANYGYWRALLDVCRDQYTLPWRTTRPQVWQKGVVPQGKDKGADKPSLLIARRLFPAAAADLRFKKDHNRADALLMARYAYHVVMGLRE